MTKCICKTSSATICVPYSLPQVILLQLWGSKLYIRLANMASSGFLFLILFFSIFSKVPAYLNVTDIAGLVKGASTGEGLGNAFLSHIKACDAMFHLCRK